MNMAKAKTIFFCTACGNESPKWQGRCPACGAWNTLEEHIEKPAVPGRAKTAPVGMSRTPKTLHEVDTGSEIRFSTGMSELNRVLGGGAVAGSLVLVGVRRVSASPHCCCKFAISFVRSGRFYMYPVKKVSGSSNSERSD